jgi:hypothetical protein
LSDAVKSAADITPAFPRDRLPHAKARTKTHDHTEQYAEHAPNPAQPRIMPASCMKWAGEQRGANAHFAQAVCGHRKNQLRTPGELRTPPGARPSFALQHGKAEPPTLAALIFPNVRAAIASIDADLLAGPCVQEDVNNAPSEGAAGRTLDPLSAVLSRWVLFQHRGGEWQIGEGPSFT